MHFSSLEGTGIKQPVHFTWILFILLSLLLNSLTPADFNDQSGWRFNNVRMIDPVDAVTPSLDLIAAYTRQVDGFVEIRVDLLEMADPWALDLIVGLDHDKGGNYTLPTGEQTTVEWDQFVIIQAAAPPAMMNSSHQVNLNIIPRVIRDESMDSIVIKISKNAFPGSMGNTKFQVWSYPPGEKFHADETSIFTNQQTLKSPAKLALVFQDVLPAATPQQALRRWDGAHTGPYGQRHGLYHLLSASSQYEIPIVLLDIKNPSSLAALDLVGGSEIVLSMETDHLLVLPDLKIFNPTASESFRQINKNYGFSSNPIQIRYDNVIQKKNDLYQYVMSQNSMKSPPQKWIPDITKDMADRSGIRTDFMKILVQNAFVENPAQLIIAVENLPKSALGDSSIVNNLFSYLDNHPWIKVVDGSDLMQFPLANQIQLSPGVLMNSDIHNGYAQLWDYLETQLSNLTQSDISSHAAIAFTNLTKPSTNLQQTQLQSSYLGDVGYLIAASHWADAPTPTISCSTDLDWDQSPECILSSNDIFSIIDPTGGQLVLLAAQIDGEPHILIEPSSLLAVGLSDPSQWQDVNGYMIDPSVITGAFDDDLPVEYDTDVQPSKVTLLHPDHHTSKVFTLTESGIRVEIIAPQSIQTQVPIVISPSQMYQPDWFLKYLESTNSTDSSTWYGLLDHPRINISIHSPAEMNWIHSLSNYSNLAEPEDPNLEREPGWFLPFPMSLMSITAQSPLLLDISIK